MDSIYICGFENCFLSERAIYSDFENNDIYIYIYESHSVVSCNRFPVFMID